MPLSLALSLAEQKQVDEILLAFTALSALTLSNSKAGEMRSERSENSASRVAIAFPRVELAAGLEPATILLTRQSPYRLGDASA